MKAIHAVLVLGLATFASGAMADELDPVAAVPQGLVVRTSIEGKREVFKTQLEKGIVDTSAKAADVLNDSVKTENKLQDVTAVGELDQVSSDDSWYFSWNWSGSYGSYSYGYRCGGYSYSYYPSYSYYSGGYNYTYYYTPSYYGYYSGSSNWRDSYGCHYSSRYSRC